MAASYGAGGQSPPVIGRPVDRVFEDAQFTGEVNLSGRKLRDYPKICTKYDLADTIHTDLSKNRFGEVPTEVCDYCNMERLNCYHNIIKSIPQAIVQLQALTHLNLSRNQLTVLPVSLCNLSSLEVLLASNNKLVSLPEEIGKLERLMDLDVSCNEISHLPPQIGDLRSLRSLNLRRNLLVELPLDICKLNLRRLDIASNRVQKIPTVFRKLEVLEEIILEHNPLESPPAHICTRGRQHIMKYLHTEAIKEDRKRGILSDSDMKRLIRKSLPPQQTSDEFRQMLEAPEAKWKRHTVLSSDSGYSTADSLDKCGWNHCEELQRQKQEYEQRKKAAEQIRLAQEEKEREERRRAAQKLQEEQRAVLERQREEQQRKEAERRQQEEEQRLMEEQRLLQEQARQEEEARLREEEARRRQEEERAKAEARQQEEERKNKAVNKNALSSQSAKDQQRRLASNTQYRRTASDSVTQKRGIPTAVNSNNHGDGLNNHINKNGLAEDDSSINPSHNSKPTTPTNPSHPSVWRLQGAGERAQSPVQSPSTRRSKPPERSSVPTPTSGRSVSRTSSTSSVSSVQSQSSTGRGPPPPSSSSAPSSSGAPRAKNHSTPTRMYTQPSSTYSRLRPPSSSVHREEEFKAKHQQVKTQHQVESQRLKSRLEDQRSKGTPSTSGAKRPGSSDTATDNKRQSAGQSGRPGATNTGRNTRPVLSAGAMKMLEDYKDVNPNFTIRRREEQQREENQQLEMLRQTIESRLKVTLPDNLPEALRDGVVLCHLANQIRPRSVASIHVPSPAVPKLTSAKCRRNVENFLDACRKIGVDQEQICVATDIMEERGLQRVAITVAALVAMGSNPRQSAV